MRTAFAVFVLLFCAAPLRAQARASITASATVVEGIAFHAGPSTLAVQPTGQLDVSTPLDVRGPTPYVLQVLRTGSPGATTLSPGTMGDDVYAVRLDAPRAEPTSLTYVIATIN